MSVCINLDVELDIYLYSYCASGYITGDSRFEYKGQQQSKTFNSTPHLAAF